VQATGALDLWGFSQTVASLTNAGLVNMGSGTSPGALLTINGNYIGQGGAIAMNTVLDTDNALTDKLVIDGGTASGTSFLHVANAGGAGAVTIGNGILVVDTINGGATDPDAFALAGRAVAGPYEYELFRSSVDASNPDAWYLRSTLDCSLEPNAAACATAPAGTPHYRVETSVYTALPSMTLLYGRTLLDTLHERVGEQEDIRGRKGSRQQMPNTGAWGRVFGTNGQQDGDALGIYGSGPQYDYDFAGLQVGQDLFRREHAGGSRDHAGVTFAYGHAKGTVTHFGGATGTNTFDAYSLGGYWTHFGESGWYIDTVLQGTYYDTTSTANTGLPDLDTNGYGLGVSLEGGKLFRFDNGIFIEPQVQLSYQTINLSDASDTKAQVTFSDVDSLTGRIGARIGRTWTLDDERQMTMWVRPNIWREFRGDPSTRFSSADGPVPFHADLAGSWGGINVGMSGQIYRNISLFANASYNERFDGKGHAYDGKIGLRINW
jgi:outer membrane autotransporter protein